MLIEKIRIEETTDVEERFVRVEEWRRMIEK